MLQVSVILVVKRCNPCQLKTGQKMVRGLAANTGIIGADATHGRMGKIPEFSLASAARLAGAL